MKKLLLLAFTCLLLHGFSYAGQVERPPQFVVMSFDNCMDLPRWYEMQTFLKKMHRRKIPLQFTFFVSGTNFLADENKDLYQGPDQARGHAKIPFGGSIQEMKQRIHLINRLHQMGNEIASHAVGHFDGLDWSTNDWETEFQAYINLFTNIAKNNGLSKQHSFAFSANKIIGFRAPFLSENPAITPVFQNYHMRYDASGFGASDLWPEKIAGIWQFNLAKIKLAGTDKMTLTMDWNIMEKQGGVDKDLENKKFYKAQTYHSYINYFIENYTGNRAPIVIGHHFTNFQNGIYNQALLKFARVVCRLPEVRCVSFESLANFMDHLTPTEYIAYQRGDFKHANLIKRLPAFD